MMAILNVSLLTKHKAEVVTQMFELVLLPTASVVRDGRLYFHFVCQSTPRGVPRSGPARGEGAYPGQVQLGGPPPPGTGQQMEYLIRRGRYASCVHAGGTFLFLTQSISDFRRSKNTDTTVTWPTHGNTQMSQPATGFKLVYHIVVQCVF